VLFYLSHLNFSRSAHRLATGRDYFLMLGAELAGEPYSEADHDNELRPLLNNRSK
jgi:hypothetical protein